MRKLIPFFLVFTGVHLFAQAEEPSQLQNPARMLTWQNVVESVCQHVKTSPPVLKIGDTADRILSELSVARRKIFSELRRSRAEIDFATEQMTEASRSNVNHLIAIKDRFSDLGATNEKELRNNIQEWLKGLGNSRIAVENDLVKADVLIEKNLYEWEFNLGDESFQLRKLRTDKPEETRYAIRNVSSLLKKPYQQQDPNVSLRWPDGSDLKAKSVHFDFGLRLQGKLNDPQYRISFAASDSGCEAVVAAKLHDAFQSSEIPAVPDQPLYIPSKVSQR